VLIVGLLSPQVDPVYVMFAKMREEKLGTVHLHDHPKRRNRCVKLMYRNSDVVAFSFIHFSD
jgi:hypothetical protein